MRYDPKTIANYFIKLSKEQKKPLSPMKLQKLIYFAHGWHLAIYDEPLINENVEAWSYGPVIPSIYHEFKEFGNKPINRYATDIETEDAILSRDEKTKALLNKIWEVYSDASAAQLSNLTHQPNSPWSNLVKELGDQIKKNTDIADGVIKDYFINKISESEVND